MRRGKTRQDRAGQGRAGQDRTRQDRTRLDKTRTGQDKARQDMSTDDRAHLRLRCRGIKLLPQCVLQHACSWQGFSVPRQDGDQPLCPPLVASPPNNVLPHIVCIRVALSWFRVYIYGLGFETMKRGCRCTWFRNWDACLHAYEPQHGQKVQLHACSHAYDPNAGLCTWYQDLG